MYVKEMGITEDSLNDVQTQSYEMLEQYYVSNTSNVEVVDFSARNLSRYKQPNHIREALKKGYVEMSHINLLICNECLHAEYEADHMVERLVSGR